MNFTTFSLGFNFGAGHFAERLERIACPLVFCCSLLQRTRLAEMDGLDWLL